MDAAEIIPKTLGPKLEELILVLFGSTTITSFWVK